MKVDFIRNGIVIDHITAGKAFEIYNLLGLDALDCSVALLKNVVSVKSGKKDIIKIDDDLDINTDLLAIIEPNATVNIIKDGEIVEKKKLTLPETVTGVLRCKNPRCITSTEQELKHIFKLTDREKSVYRCIYCETKAK